MADPGSLFQYKTFEIGFSIKLLVGLPAARVPSLKISKISIGLFCGTEIFKTQIFASAVRR